MKIYGSMDLQKKLSDSRDKHTKRSRCRIILRWTQEGKDPMNQCSPLR